KKKWEKRNAIAAFDAALTRSGYDPVFRNRLTASVESARQAVSEEGQVTIPENVIIMTHEDNLSGNYHVFDLPPFNENAHVAEEYHIHLGCCYDPWAASAGTSHQTGTGNAQTNGLKEWNQTTARNAFTASLTKSVHDKAFRNRSTASPESAKQAVSDEGQIVVPDVAVILFHENNSNENYHIIDLRKF